MTLKLIQIGNSVGVVLPKEVLLQLGLDKGDELSLRKENGHYLLSPLDPEFEKTLEHAREAMNRYKNTLSELAK